MALFTSHPHHPLFYWCLPQVALYIPCIKNLVLPSNMTSMKDNMPVSPHIGIGMSALTILEKIGLHLWEVMKKVMHHCVNITELRNSKVFVMCARETVAMTGDSKKSTVGLEAQEGPAVEARRMEIQPASLCSIIELEPQIKIMEDSKMKGDGDEVVLADWLEWEYDEEEEDCDDDGGSDDEDDDNDDDDDDDDDDQDEGKEEQFCLNKDDETEWTDEEDSDWSDDEGNSEASTESTELWESFFNNDPHNPLYFSCATGVKTKSSDDTLLQNHTASSPSEVKKSTSVDVEEQSTKKSTKEETKKVRFSEEVTVHHLVTWSFASWEARDGSCWLQLARDRERFRRRVERTGEVLSPCLTAQHRARVWDRLQREAQPELS